MKNMNYYEYTILKCKKENPDLNQREIAKKCDVSLGMVNKVLNSNKDLIINKTSRNAVILAAGVGQRLLPLNNIQHKAFIKIKDEYLIERLIKQLKQADINDISVVVGYRKQDFDFLIDLYGVNLIINKHYRDRGSFYSLYLARDKINNTFILPCDIYLKENVFKDYDYYSYYGLKNIKNKQAYVDINKKKEIIKSNTGYVDCGGLCYIDAKDSLNLKTKLESSQGYYFEEALFDKNKMYVFPKFLNNIYEINNFKDIVSLDKESESLKHPALDVLKQVFKTDLNDIQDLKLLKEGMTNDSFIFSLKNKRYIMRIPGAGSEKLIRRKEEKIVYELIKNYHISDELVYLNAENGYKITEFLEGCHNLDASNLDELKKAMKLLKSFHDLNLQVEHSFNLFEKIEFYEKLNTNKSKYQDYALVKANVLSLKSIIDKSKKNWTLCHIDSVCDNFLVTDKEIRLIDFEYSAMQDSDLDLIMFASYSYFNQQQIEELFEIYYGYKMEAQKRIKVYSYMAVVGLLWSNWCEYKESLNQEFGEYGYKQYRYAKDFYKLVKKLEDTNV